MQAGKSHRLFYLILYKVPKCVYERVDLKDIREFRINILLLVRPSEIPKHRDTPFFPDPT